MKLRAVLWPRGDFFFATQLPGLSHEKPSRKLIDCACKIVWKHGFHRRSTRINCHDWLMLAREIVHITEECALAIFTSAIAYEASIKNCNLSGENQDNQETDLAILASILCRLEFEDPKDFLDSLRNNMESILSLLSLCNEATMERFIITSEFNVLPRIENVSNEALHKFDFLFEGSIITYPNDRKISCAQVVTIKCSEVLREIWPNLNQVYLSDVDRFMKRKLQNDMFVLNENSKFFDTPRRITSTMLPHHRKLTICSWSRMEVLTSPMYRGVNLRILNGTAKSSWLFHLQYTNTVLIKDCDGCRPIVLGPVKDLVVIQNVKDCCISVICRRLIVTDSEDVTIFLNTATKPIVIGNCQDIRFAPYNVYCDNFRSSIDSSYFNSWMKRLVDVRSSTEDFRENFVEDFEIQAFNVVDYNYLLRKVVK